MQQFVNVNEVIKPKYVRWGRVNCREERKGGGTTRRHHKEAPQEGSRGERRGGLTQTSFLNTINLFALLEVGCGLQEPAPD